MAASGRDERGVAGEVCTEDGGVGGVMGAAGCEVRWWSGQEREGDRK